MVARRTPKYLCARVSLCNTRASLCRFSRTGGLLERDLQRDEYFFSFYFQFYFGGDGGGDITTMARLQSACCARTLSGLLSFPGVFDVHVIPLLT